MNKKLHARINRALAYINLFFALFGAGSVGVIVATQHRFPTALAVTVVVNALAYIMCSNSADRLEEES